MNAWLVLDYWIRGRLEVRMSLIYGNNYAIWYSNWGVQHRNVLYHPVFFLSMYYDCIMKTVSSNFYQFIKAVTRFFDVLLQCMISSSGTFVTSGHSMLCLNSILSLSSLKSFKGSDGLIRGLIRGAMA